MDIFKQDIMRSNQSEDDQQINRYLQQPFVYKPLQTHCVLTTPMPTFHLQASAQARISYIGI
jgi:hypothetical protein